MKKNIILSVVLALVMMMSILPMSAFAAEAGSVYYAATKTIIVDEPDDLRWLSTYDGSIDGMPATFAGWTIEIVENIDLQNVAWTPIADFRGKMIGVTDIEGGVVTISNLKVDVTTEGAGLCAKSGGGARFENLMISNSDIKTTKPYAGAFIGNGFTSTFINCHTFNTDVYGDRFVGGIVGFNYGSMTGCSVKADDNETIIHAKELTGIIGSISSSGDNVGGIVGQIGEGNFVISDCVVDGVQVKATRQVGGIAGMAMYQNTVTNCRVSNTTIYASSNRDYVRNGSSNSRTASAGGIVGQIQPSSNTVITITDNIVSRTSVSRNGSTKYSGWILGDVSRASSASEYYLNNNTYPSTGLLEIGGAN